MYIRFLNIHINIYSILQKLKEKTLHFFDDMIINANKNVGFIFVVAF